MVTTLQVTATTAELTGAMVKMCNPDGCTDITLAASSFVQGGFDGVGSGTFSTAKLTPQASGAFLAELYFEIPVGTQKPIDEAPPDQPVSMKIVSSDGARVLAEVERTPQFEPEYPNGESCGVVCFSAEL